MALGLFAAGALIGGRLTWAPLLQSGTMILGLAGVLVALAVVGPRRARPVLLGLCVLALGTGWTLLRVGPGNHTRLDRIVDALDGALLGVGGRAPIEVRGLVTDGSRSVHRPRGLADPPMWPGSSVQARLRVESLLVHTPDGRTDWVACHGTLRLIVRGDRRLRAGERVELLGTYTPPGTRRNPGDPDWALLAAQSGRVGTMVIESDAHVCPGAPGGLVDRSRSWLARVRAELRGRALRSVGIDESRPSDPGVALRSALLLGERDPSFDDVFSRFQRVGVAHVLAISGFHLALVLWGCLMLVRLCGDHPRVEAGAVALVLVLVMLLIPLRPPIVRGGVIVGALLLARSLGRSYDRLTVLSWVGLGLLVWRPLDVGSMGYQLSMGVTALLVVLSDLQIQGAQDRGQGLGDGAQAKGRAHKAMLWLGEVLRTHFACWLVALGVIVQHAGVVGVLAPVVSLVMVPIVALMMALGYMQIVLGVVAPGWAAHTLWLIDAPSSWTLALVSWVDGLSFAWVRVPAVSAAWAIATTLLLAVISTRPACLRRWPAWAGLLLVAAWALAQPALHRPESPVRVVMLDVGDGSCVLIQSGNTGVLWDCGSLDRRVGDPVARSLRTLGVVRLGSVIVTHDNLDHYNGLPNLADSIEIGEVLITDRLRTRPSRAFQRVREDLERRELSVAPLRAGDRVPIDREGVHELEIVWPTAEVPEAFDDNDTSLVALLPMRAGGSLLLTGDIEGPAMARIRELSPGLPGRLRAGVVELPHHGSARAEAAAFIDWLNPGVVIQSTGASRLNDERWDAQRVGRVWHTTGAVGAIVVDFEDDGRIRSRAWFPRGPIRSRGNGGARP